VVAGGVVVGRHIGASGRCVGRCGVTHPVGEQWLVSLVFPTSTGVVLSKSASRRAMARAARRRFVRARRERWLEQRWCRDAEGPAAPGGAGAGVTAAGVAGTGPGPVGHHGWSSARLLMRIR
jgi:hypothetical protein